MRVNAILSPLFHSNRMLAVPVPVLVLVLVLVAALVVVLVVQFLRRHKI